MAKIFILLGLHHSGKSKTMNILYGVRRWTRPFMKVKTINRLPVFAVYNSSPQEKCKHNYPPREGHNTCTLECVMRDVNQRLNSCIEKQQNQEFGLLLPFTMLLKGQNQLECICNPINQLKQAHKVYIIFLKRRESEYPNCISQNDIMRTIESHKDGEESQANQLEETIASYA